MAVAKQGSHPPDKWIAKLRHLLAIVSPVRVKAAEQASHVLIGGHILGPGRAYSHSIVALRHGINALKSSGALDIEDGVIWCKPASSYGLLPRLVEWLNTTEGSPFSIQEVVEKFPDANRLTLITYCASLCDRQDPKQKRGTYIYSGRRRRRAGVSDG